MTSAQSLLGILDFIHQSEGLKTLLRHSWLSNSRQESVAEHTWRMALMAIILHRELEKDIDIGHTIKMIIIHDLAEVIAGDHHAWKGPLKNKHELEEQGLKKLISSLPTETADEIIALWNEFESNDTEEARFAQAMDKLEVLIQHNEADLSTWNEKEMTFNLSYGNDKVAYNSILELFRNLVKEESELKLRK